MNVKEATAFVDKHLKDGTLTAEHIAYLAEFFQSMRMRNDVDDDGKPGEATLRELAEYVAESTPKPDPRSPFANWYFPMCAKNGERARISNKFGASRDKGKRRHAGVDIMNPLIPPIDKDATPEKLRKWYVMNDQDPVLAMGPGKVVGARWGIALNGERVLSVTIDHGAVGEFKQLGSFYLHCARLLCKPGDHVEAGQVIAITGHTATNINHQHDEMFTGGTRSGHQIDPAPILAQMKHRDMDPGSGKFNPDWLREDLGPAQ